MFHLHENNLKWKFADGEYSLKIDEGKIADFLQDLQLNTIKFNQLIPPFQPFSCQNSQQQIKELKPCLLRTFRDISRYHVKH